MYRAHITVRLVLGFLVLMNLIRNYFQKIVFLRYVVLQLKFNQSKLGAGNLHSAFLSAYLGQDKLRVSSEATIASSSASNTNIGFGYDHHVVKSAGARPKWETIRRNFQRVNTIREKTNHEFLFNRHNRFLFFFLGQYLLFITEKKKRWKWVTFIVYKSFINYSFSKHIK